MPRWSRTMHDEQGRVVGHLCGHTPYRKCSTPDCGNHAGLECDHPVQRKVRAPKVGDTRLHKERQVLYYVRQVLPGGVLEVSAGEMGKVKVVTLEEWNTKADATCDRRICERCAVKVNGKDWCPAHARAAGVL